MVVEEKEASNSTMTEEPMMSSSNPEAVEDDEVEEGEIVGEESGDDSKAAAAASSGGSREEHALENAWTFWFDNPSAKSKQAAWGSSIRSIYTFSTVEEFWRSALIKKIFFLCFSLYYLYSYI